METDARPSFASLLREHRLARGLSQETLAEAAGLSRDAIGLLERGARRSPRPDTVALLARALKLSGDERARLLASASGRTAASAAAATSTGSAPAFATLLKDCRVAAGLTQEALAERAGLSARGVQNLEKGVHQPYPDTLDRLVQALGLAGDERACFEAAGRSLPRHGAPGRGDPGDVAPRHNLPAQVTSLIGRAQATAEVRQSLGASRLVTLVGSGGVGKTRLALETAEGLLDRFPDGVWLVELAALADPTLVPSAVAAALDIREQPGRPVLETLREALRPRRLLLALDNCEHLLDACAQLADALLRACPELRILATSREPLRIGSEVIWRVPSLTVPDDERQPLAELAKSEAVRLFAERAEAVRPGFALSAGNGPAVSEVCRRLDGIPLALELAAARLSGMGMAELAAHLDQRFQLLTEGSPTALPRQQTLRATMEWSYSLLTPQEQTLFTRLSVFAGWWSLEGAEAVGAGGAIATDEVLDLLGRLVDRSLVLAEETDDGRTQYRLLETLRQYGKERLLAHGESADCQRRHAAYYLALAERAEPEVIGPGQLRWLDRLEREHDNLRAALAWCRDTSPRAGETGLRLAGSLHFFWLFRDHHAEGLAWLERALAFGADAPAPVRTKAMCNAGVLAGLVNDLARSHALLTQSIALSREVDDTRQLSMALCVLGSTPWGGDQDEQAVVVLEEGLALARAAGEPWLIGHAHLHSLFRVANSAAIERADERARAWVAGTESLHFFKVAGATIETAVAQPTLGQIALYERDYTRARAAFEECLPNLRAQGWRSTVADGLVGLADVAHEQGDDGAAATFYAEGLTLYRQGGDQLATAIPRVLCRLADMAQERGDWAAARTHVRECLAIARDKGEVGASEIASALAAQAALAAMRGAPVRAVRLAGAAAGLRTHLDRPLATSEQAIVERRLTYLPPSPRSPAAYEQATVERRLAPARQALSPDAQAAAWAVGKAMTREQAIADALRDEADD